MQLDTRSSIRRNRNGDDPSGRDAKAARPRQPGFPPVQTISARTPDTAIGRIDGISDAAGSGMRSLVAYTYLGLGMVVQEADGNR